MMPVTCAIDSIPVAAVCFKVLSGADYVFTACNNAFIQLFGTDVTGTTFSDLPSGLINIFKEIAKNVELSKYKFVCSDKQYKYNVNIGISNGVYTVCIDKFKFQDTIVEDQLKLALETIPTGIVAAESNGRVFYINPAACRLTGWGKESIGQPVSKVLNLSYENSPHAINLLSYCTSQKSCMTLAKSMVLINKKGKSINILANIVQIEPTAGDSSIVIFLNDVTEQKRQEKEVTYLSYHDKLTGLFNRAYFEKKLKEFDHESYYPISIIMGDANGLKMTNDIFGHRQGDLLLVTIANILSLACRENDIVARYGGDEFVMLLPNTPLETAAKICRTIMDLCGTQECDQNKVSISLGYSCKTKSDENINDTLNVAEDFMYRHKLLESRSYHSNFVSSLKNMLFEKSFETEEHAMRLTGLCAKAGRIMGLSQSDMNDLELFSMLHDIGKISIKDQVLLKPGRLNEEEWMEMRRHCETGYRIARSAPELSHIADYILCHHEHYDGGGYPQGLKGDQIPLLSRILAVADAYDAMVNDRCYRKAMNKSAAIAELKKCAGTQFDPEIVKVFLHVLEPEVEEIQKTSA
jgi:diguanylate cyclase (GGDEF)-like protein/PAS domain S-box-containing protein